MERFGDYVVTGSLGQGAMGVVIRVRHVTLGVERALKLLAQVTPEGLARFEREARTLAEVRHPNVVGVHEAGVRDGRPWFVMDLVEGRPLDELLRRSGRLPVAQVLSLGAGLARGLAALHASGVVHRDLKPSNVLVRADGSPVIVDLGVAITPGSEDDRLTRSGALVGTVSYMAPEQLVGERATAASDVYALGALLFEAACGRPSAPDAPSLQEFMSRVVDGPTPRVGDVDPDLPAALDRLLVRVMARGASGRPSALEVAAALEAPGVTTSGPARVRQRRRPGVVIAALALVAVAGLVVTRSGRSGTPELTAPPRPRDPAPVASTAPVVDAAAVTRAYERALALPEPLTRRRALAGWLRANPTDPRAARALAAWQTTLREAPLAVWPLAPGKPVEALLRDDGEALAWIQGEPGLWLADPWTGAGRIIWKEAELLDAVRAPGGEVLVGAGRRLFSVSPRASDVVERRVRTGRDGPVRALALTGRRCAFVTSSRVHVFERDGGAVTTLGPFEDPREVAFADDGRLVVVATGSTNDSEATWLHSIDVASGEKLLAQVMGPRVSVLVATTGAVVLAGTTGATLLLLDVRTGELKGRFGSVDVRRMGLGVAEGALAHDVAVRDAVLVDGGRRLVSAGGNIGGARGDLRCWDVASGGELAPPLRFPAACLRLDVARDERTILISFDSGVVEVWAAPHRPAELDVDRSTP